MPSLTRSIVAALLYHSGALRANPLRVSAIGSSRTDSSVKLAPALPKAGASGAALAKLVPAGSAQTRLEEVKLSDDLVGPSKLRGVHN